VNDLSSSKSVPVWRLVAYTVLAAAGVVVVGYTTHDHRLYYFAPFAGILIGTFGALANRARESDKLVEGALPETKPRFNYAAIAAGVFFAIWGLIAISAGEITSGRSYSHTYSMANEPQKFWFLVGIRMAFAAACFFYGFTGRN
jgi:hypothetical protein